MRKYRPVRLLESARAWWRADSGMITIELGLVLLLLVMVAIGAYDLGRFGIHRAVLTSAINAGAHYAIQDQAAAEELDAIKQIVRDEAADMTTTIEVAARNYCSCAVGGSEVNCNSNCSDGKYPPYYLEITASDEIRLLFDYPGLPQSYPITVQSVSRIR